MTCRAGLADLAIRYQRIAALTAAEAMDLRIALARMGTPPDEDQVLMSRHYDRAAKAAADAAQLTLQAVLFFTDDAAPRRAA